MMDKQKKYTHLIEKCNSLIKEFSDMNLEAYTGDNLSISYWRLREGKGLQHLADKANLDRWCKMITSVRRFFSSPSPLPTEMYENVYAEREKLLEQMEDYRSWLADGSKPTYLYDTFEQMPEQHIVHIYATYYTLSKLTNDMDFSLDRIEEELKEAGLTPNQKEYQNFVKEALRNFWFNTDMKEFAKMERFIFDVLLPIWEASENEKHKLTKVNETMNQLGYDLPKNDRIYHIRTDMDHRSSKGALINPRLNWILSVKPKSVTHERIYEYNEIKIDYYVRWKREIQKFKQDDPKYKPIIDDCYRILLSAIHDIKVPRIDKIKKI